MMKNYNLKQVHVEINTSASGFLKSLII
ncbi:uncharacterized protein METZ01_LOCUS466350, partial [marine metagenome]